MDEPLSQFVDIPGFRRALEGQGCRLPERFEEDLEVHLKILGLRYRTWQSSRKIYKNSSEISQSARRFFQGDAYEWGSHYVVFDESTIRGWKTDIYKPRPVVGSPPEDLNGELRKIRKAIEGEEGRRIAMADLRERIPRTYRYRHGGCAFVTLDFSGEEVKFDNSPEMKKGRKAACFPTHLWSFYLLVFGSYVQAVFSKGKLLLHDDDYFVAQR